MDRRAFLLTGGALAFPFVAEASHPRYESSAYAPRSRVLSLGGAGGLFADHLVSQGLTVATGYLAVDTDPTALAKRNTMKRLLISASSGTEGNLDLHSFLMSGDQLLLLAGLGGKATSDNLLPILAMARHVNVPCTTLAILPFAFELDRAEAAREMVLRLKTMNVPVVLIENTPSANMARSQVKFQDWLEFINQQVYQAAQVWILGKKINPHAL